MAARLQKLLARSIAKFHHASTPYNPHDSSEFAHRNYLPNFDQPGYVGSAGLLYGALFIASNSFVFSFFVQVTKHLRKIIIDSSQLQYTIELGKHRMVSTLPPSVGPSFSTRLKLLRERERAWKYLDWKKKDTLRLPPTGSVYEFVGGLYGNGREDESRVTASISFLELPSTDDPGQNLQTWTHSMGDIIIVDFTMDPSQDLLVLVALAPAEYVANLLTLPLVY